MRVLELFELQAQEGPCLDAFRAGEQIEHHDLSEKLGPWPRFTVVALECGFQSVLALPLRLRDQTIGALNLFRTAPSSMNDSDIMVARAFADLATISVLQHGAAAETHRVNEQLTRALASRIVIEQAKGVVFERAGVDMTEAFSRLRAYARAHNRRLSDVAQSTIDGSLDPRVWSSP
jgi:GAF domain-containing protein